MLPGPRRYGADLGSPHPGGHSTLGLRLLVLPISATDGCRNIVRTGQNVRA